MAEDLKIKPFRVHFNVWVECMDFERLDESETEEEARTREIEDVRKGFRQVDYNVEWDIETGDVEPLNEKGETDVEAAMRELVSNPPRVDPVPQGYVGERP